MKKHDPWETGVRPYDPVLKVPCPECRAPAGGWCHEKLYGFTCANHERRVELAAKRRAERPGRPRALVKLVRVSVYVRPEIARELDEWAKRVDRDRPSSRSSLAARILTRALRGARRATREPRDLA